MTIQEGVVKYQCEYTPAPALPAAQISELNAWRKLMVLARLIGQNPDLYGGYGYGNISHRLDTIVRADGRHPFVITGTQTGGKAELTPDDYVVVTACHPEENWLAAQGPVKPSSEALTHGAVYALDSQILWVVHAHSPEIWHNAEALGVPMTANVPYGTPEMAAEVRRLYAESDLPQKHIFGMAGHEDGIVTYGHTAEEAGFTMLSYLVRALQISERKN
ncbi:MAG TPA: class II aldolase [Chloroflexi bacterium]|nr:class II aldolase [Chloroflexota bacterium]HHW87530.1 class II aldolase/adducin family protein [Chloroflexota bacterium]